VRLFSGLALKMMEIRDVYERDAVEHDEVRLFDLWLIIRARWYWILGGMVAGAFVWGGALAVLPTLYEATAIVQIGQVDGVQVESAAQAVERIGVETFQVEAAKLSGYAPWIAAVGRSTNAGKDYFSAQVVPGTSLIKIEAKATTPIDAEKIANALIEILAQRHQELAAPTVSQIKENIAQSQRDLEITENDLELLGTAFSRDVKRDTISSQVELIRQLKRSELLRDRQAIGRQKLALSSPATQRTRAIEAIFVPDVPVSPKRRRIAGLAVLGGALVGLLAAVLVSAPGAAGERSC
jgi:hypothetical protein